MKPSASAQGQSMVEYALICALVGLALIGFVALLDSSQGGFVYKVMDKLTAWTIDSWVSVQHSLPILFYY